MRDLIASQHPVRSGPQQPQSLVQTAKDRLRQVPYSAVQRLECQYDRGSLALRGQVPSYYQKQLAQEALADLRHLVQIVNEAQVV